MKNIYSMNTLIATTKDYEFNEAYTNIFICQIILDQCFGNKILLNARRIGSYIYELDIHCISLRIRASY